MDSVDVAFYGLSISGPFRITAIKHILPQKRPEEENLLPGFAFRPVTGIFVHRSADVLSVALESGDTLGVTSAHPIYSLTHGGWRLAGELEPGEEVLAYAGSSRASVASLPGAHRVYNLEVQGVGLCCLPTDINQRTNHVGGATIIQKGGKGSYPNPGNVSKRGCY